MTILSVIYISEVGWNERPINFGKDFTASLLTTSIIGCLACCNGDTWASEIGTAIGPDTPRLVTTLRKVPAGTNGAVSLVGLLSSLLGGLVIGIAYLLTDLMFIEPNSFLENYPPQWPILTLSMYAGLFGSLVDSYLGALLQYSGFCSLRKKIVSKHSKHTTKHISGVDLFDNDQVNLLSSFIMAITTPLLGYYAWEYIEASQT